MNALLTLPGKHQFSRIEFVIPWQYHKGGHCNAYGYDALVYIPVGAAEHCDFFIVKGGPEVEEPQILISALQ